MSKEKPKTEDLRQQYEHAYDSLCDYLDNQFKEKNLCDFQNGKCAVMRQGKPTMCCYSYDLDFFTNVRNKKTCQYLGESGCTTKCLACKIYTCRYLQNKGFKFTVSTLPDIKKVFNRKQREVFMANPFTLREEIIDQLIKVKKSRMPYFLFYLLNKGRIKDDKNKE